MTRYLLATMLAGAAQGWIRIESHAGVLRQLSAVIPQWVETLLSTGLLVLIALAVGVVTAPRGAICAFFGFITGIALWVVLYLRPSPPETSDVWGYEQWGSFILSLLPTTIIATGLGALASWLAMRVRESGLSA